MVRARTPSLAPTDELPRSAHFCPGTDDICRTLWVPLKGRQCAVGENIEKHPEGQLQNPMKRVKPSTTYCETMYHALWVLSIMVLSINGS